VAPLRVCYTGFDFNTAVSKKTILKNSQTHIFIMNPLNLFILVSQLSLGLYVAASPSVPSVAQRPPEKLCDMQKRYAGKLFNLYTTQTGGEKVMVTKDGNVQVGGNGGNGGYPFTASFVDEPAGSTPEHRIPFPWTGSLRVLDDKGQLLQYAYLSPRPNPDVSGGGFALRVKVPPEKQPPATEWKRDVVFGFNCISDSPTLLTTNLDDSRMMGCAVEGGALNIAYGVRADATFNSRCNHIFEYLWIAYIP
jgi:hypothetical protein